MKKHLALMLAGAMAVLAAPAFAADKIVVEKNHTHRIALSAPAGSVVVGNPDIADVTVVDSRTVFIVARGVGNSGITITDRSGRTLYNAEVTVTTASEGAITVYKGLKPSLMVCTNVCVSQEVTAETAAPGTLSTVPAAVLPAPVIAQ